MKIKLFVNETQIGHPSSKRKIAEFAEMKDALSCVEVLKHKYLGPLSVDIEDFIGETRPLMLRTNNPYEINSIYDTRITNE